MIDLVRFWSMDVLIVLGLVLMSLSVYGMFWMPDPYTRLHAASKGIVVGNLFQLAAVVLIGDAAIAARAILIGVALLITTPIVSHVIAHAAYEQDEPMRTPGAIDESGHHLPLDQRSPTDASQR